MQPENQNRDSDPSRPPIKLVSKGRIALMLVGVFAGAFYYCAREYYTTGVVSGTSLGASVFALAVGVITLSVVTWYANKPEK